MILNVVENLKHGESAAVIIKGKLTKIETYLSDSVSTQILNDFIPHTRKIPNLFLYDLTIEFSEGKLKFLLNPLLSKIQKGQIVEDMFLIITKITKVYRQDFFFIMIDEVNSISGEGVIFCDKTIDIENERSFNVPRGGMIGNYYLHPFTLCDISHEKGNKKIKSISFNEVCNIYNQITLKYLDDNWQNTSLTRVLIVRVLSKSKIKVLIGKNTSSPLTLLCNLLIADNTGFSKITAFDEAAISIFDEVHENDILVMKSYKTSKYKQKNVNYLRYPKCRVKISPTEIEIKINLWNLNSILKLNCEVNICPKPLWALQNLKSLTETKQQSKCLVDVIGILMACGRVEREPIFCNNKKTGMFYIRKWAKLQDNTTGKAIFVKLYLKLPALHKLSKIIPGDLVMFTNLMIHEVNGILTHLESSNETSIFTDEDFKSAKFYNCKRWIENLRKSVLYTHLNEWIEKYESSTFMGYMYPLKDIVSKNIKNIFFTKKFQVANILINLPMKTLTRFIIKGEFINSTHIKINNGKVLTDIVPTKFDGPILGHNKPMDLPIKCKSMKRSDIQTLQSYLLEDMQMHNVHFHDCSVIICEIKIDDCLILCEYYKGEQTLPEINTFNSFEIECFRFKANRNIKATSDGIQFILNGSHKRENLVSQEDEDYGPVDTQDVVDALNQIDDII